MRYQSLRNRPVLQEVRELVSSRVMTLEVVKEVGEVPLTEEEVEIEAAEVLEEVHLTVDNDLMTGNRSRRVST